MSTEKYKVAFWVKETEYEEGGIQRFFDLYFSTEELAQNYVKNVNSAPRDYDLFWRAEYKGPTAVLETVKFTS